MVDSNVRQLAELPAQSAELVPIEFLVRHIDNEIAVERVA